MDADKDVKQIAHVEIDVGKLEPLSSTKKTLSAWYYTLLLKVFSYKFAATDYTLYGSLIRMPLAFFATIGTVLQGTEFISKNEALFYIYFGIQIVCNFLTLLNMKLSYTEHAEKYKILAQKYEGRSYKVRDMINMKENDPAKVRKLTKKLETMITKDQSVSSSYESRAKEEVKRNRRLFRLAGIDLTGDTDDNTRRPSNSNPVVRKASTDTIAVK